MGYGHCDQRTSHGCEGLFFIGDCGFETNHTVNLYTSPDLIEWTFVANIFSVENRPEGIYYRPKLIYNKKNKEYIMWINWVKNGMSFFDYFDTSLIVATSPNATGPF